MYSDDSTVEQQLTPSSYDPFFLDDDTYGKYGLDPSSLVNSIFLIYFSGVLT
jgi:hypothetical protein